jgi:uncharacterized protein
MIGPLKMRRLLLVAAGLLVLLTLLYFVAGYVVYTQAANVRGSCDRHLANSPDHFEDISKWGGDLEPLDLSAFYMPKYTSVRFSSRDPGMEIAGWYIENDPDAPAIIILDGLGGCKHAQAALVPAGILWHNGFNVLVIDLRDTGDSGEDDGYSSVGTEEYLDVLGAWDWLVEQQAFAPARVGVLANSLGAASGLIAFVQEPRLAALVLNSPFANLSQIFEEELSRQGLPTQVTPAGLIMARVVRGENLTAFNPLQLIQQIGDRPLFILHSTADQRVRIHHSYQLQAAAHAAAVNAEFWFFDEVGHVRAPGLLTEEFSERVSGFFRHHLTQ